MSTIVLHPGDGGYDVGQLQQALLELGESIDSAETTSVRYGPSTQAAVSAYQRVHGLVVDGIAGPRTMDALHGVGDARYTAAGWRLDLAAVRPALVEVIRWAVSQFGTVEEPPGSNRGRLIDQWNAAAGIDAGSAWCAAFATSAYRRCDEPPIPVLGSALKVKTWGEEHGRIVPPDAPLLPGDLGVRMRDPFHGHAWLVATLLDDGREATAEGNAGNACRGLLRERAQATCYVRPLPL